jgi:hypothetical protein
MVWPAVELGLRRAHVARQNAAVVQTCVPTVTINGPSYRMRRHHDRIEQLRAGLPAAETGRQ